MFKCRNLLQSFDCCRKVSIKTCKDTIIIHDRVDGTNLFCYPIDTVKLDQSFIARITADDESLEIVRSIVTMAHNLKMDVIAEGVETREQLERLRDLGCEYGQGFYFSRPVERDAAEALLMSNWTG